MALVTDGPRTRGRPFVKGVSGNPAGRPQGSRNRRTLELEALLDAAGEALLSKLIERALEGDVSALRACMKIFFPTGRKPRIAFPLPALENVGDCLNAQAMVVDAAAQGVLALDDAKALTDLLESHRVALSQARLEAGSSHR